jgi:MFS family permease
MVSDMRRRRLLHNRDYMLLWSGEVASELGSQSSAVAYPLLILALTGSAAKAGVVALAKWLPIAVFAIPAGALADRVDRKRLMIACNVVRLVGAASIVASLVISAPSYGQILAVAFVDGALFTVSYVSERGALRQVVPAEEVHDAVAQNEARTFAATIAGPPLGGALFAPARSLPFIAAAHRRARRRHRVPHSDGQFARRQRSRGRRTRSSPGPHPGRSDDGEHVDRLARPISSRALL